MRNGGEWRGKEKCHACRQDNGTKRMNLRRLELGPQVICKQSIVIWS